MNLSNDKPWWRQPFKLEHSRWAYMADLWFYAVASLAWVIGMVVRAWSWPVSWQLGSLGAFVLGVLSWTLLEYGIHRFVFHGVQPFQRWHHAHHERPRALIASPTLLSLLIFMVCVAWPAYRWTPAWMGLSLAGGVFTGSAAYSWLHHHIHQNRMKGSWMMNCKIRHALHPRPGVGVCYGGTTPLWDKGFNTAWDVQRSRSSGSD